MTRGLCALVLVAACSGQTTPQAPSNAQPAKPNPERAAPPPDKLTLHEPAPRKETDGRPFATPTVEPLGPVALSADGRRLVALSESGDVTIQWNIEDGVLISDDDGPMRTSAATAKGLTVIDDHFVAWFSNDEQLSLIEVVVFKPGGLVKLRVPAMWGQPSPDKTTLAVFALDKPDVGPPYGVRLYDWPDLVLGRTLPSDTVAGVAFEQNGRRLFAGEEFGRLSVWDTNSGDRTPMLDSPDPINAVLTALDVSPDGQSLIVGGGAYLGGGNGATSPPVPLLQLWSTDPLRMVDQWHDVRSVDFVAFLDDSTFVHHTMGQHSHAFVQRRDPVTAKWIQQADFEQWGPDYVVLDRRRQVLFGTQRGSTHVACLDLSERGQCPDAS